jgi:hypothetical protein
MAIKIKDMVELKTLMIILIVIVSIDIIMKLKDMFEHFKAEPNVLSFAKSPMWSNGGVFAGETIDPEPRFQTKIACSCSGYGVPRAASDNMPYNDDSNLYNSKLLKKQFDN